MKRLIKISLLLLAFLLPETATAYEFEIGGVYFMTDMWGDYAMVCDKGEEGPSYSGKVTIPAEVTNDGTTYPVIRINAYAFSNCAGLTGVTFPSSVAIINDHSFENCTALTALELPDALEEIETAAFEGCTGITQVNIPAGVKEIKMWAFQNCTGLTDVYCFITDPYGMTLGYNAFYLESENYSSRTLHVPAGTADVFHDSDWNDYFGKIVEM